MTGNSRIPLGDALRVVRELRRDDEVVVTAMGTAREWMAEEALHPLDFIYVPSSMGQATSLGLGIALARPKTRVIVAGGDGALLMNLGSLVTITACAPPNLTVIVFDNGVYEVTGAQPTPGAATIRRDRRDIDFPAAARACGFRLAEAFDSLEPWAARARALIDAAGPTYVHLKVAPVPGGVGPRSPSPAAPRARAFAEALARTLKRPQNEAR